MKLYPILYLTLTVCTAMAPLVAMNGSGAKKQAFPTFHAWKEACDALPPFNGQSKNPCQTPLHPHVFLQEIDTFLVTMQQEIKKINWINGIKPAYLSDTFQAYAQKLVVPADAVVAIHGDLHGDVHSVNRFIATCAKRGFLDEQNPFKIKNKNFYMLFLGDYVDRGWYGAEVLYTIVRLKNENPDQVFMVRGNHEDVALNNQCKFGVELEKKFFGAATFKKINQLYNTLPVVLYLGAGKEGKYNIIQCCHGGIEIGFDPKRLLESGYHHAGVTITHLTQKSGFHHICCTHTCPLQHYFKDKPISTSNGFMWSDFIVNPHNPLSLSARDGFAGTMFAYGQLPTKQLLTAWSGKSYQLRSIFRAHQHGDEDMRNRILNLDKLSHPFDRGIGKLWIHNSIHQYQHSLLDNVAALTFSVAPDAGFGWPIQSFGLLHVAPDYSDWRLENVIVQPTKITTPEHNGSISAVRLGLGVAACLIAYMLYKKYYGQDQEEVDDENTENQDAEKVC